METNSNNDFDRLEKLLQTKRFDELTIDEIHWVGSQLSEDEYSYMAEMYLSLKIATRMDEIEPSANIKNRLDKALMIKRSRKDVFQFKITVYQMVAVVVIFFFMGYCVHVFQPVQTKIVHTTSQVIKYVDRPVKEIRYVKISVPKEEMKTESREGIPKNTQPIEINSELSELNTEYIRQQEIALTNNESVLNEGNGISIGSDTVLQKMLVTIY